jgi:hypothetical protein
MRDGCLSAQGWCMEVAREEEVSLPSTREPVSGAVPGCTNTHQSIGSRFYFTAVLNSLPGINLGTLEAAMVISCLV